MFLLAGSLDPRNLFLHLVNAVAATWYGAVVSKKLETLETLDANNRPPATDRITGCLPLSYCTGL
jgi:hypothetical protein